MKFTNILVCTTIFRIEIFLTFQLKNNYTVLKIIVETKTLSYFT